LLGQTPTTAHLRSSFEIFEVIFMALAIGDLEIIQEKWCQPCSLLGIGFYPNLLEV
jgi:hypothetical protein